MTEKIKESVIFQEQSSSVAGEDLTAQQLFAEQEAFTLAQTPAVEEQAEIEDSLHNTLQPKSSLFKRLFKWGLGLGTGLGVWQGVDSFYQAWLAQDYLVLGWIGAISLLAGAGIGAIGRELLILRRLKSRELEKSRAQELLDSYATGNAKAFCSKLAKASAISTENPSYDAFLNTITPTHSDQDVVLLFDAMVLTTLDKKALASVQRHSRQAAIMVALSPLALADILLVAWRNLSLVQEISSIYGVKLSYWSRLRLFKTVLFNMAFAGVSEIAIDTGLDALSMDVTAKLSSRVAQGIGVGLISARLGLKTMQIMRPLPYSKETAPKLADIRRMLISDLNKK